MIVLQMLVGMIASVFLLLFGLLLLPIIALMWAVGMPVSVKQGKHKDVYRWFTKIRTEVVDDDRR